MKRGELFEAALALLLILLAFTLCLAILSGGSYEEWAISGPVAHTGFWVYDNMYAPGNGVLYTVDGSSVFAIGPDGKVIWSLPIPDKYNINNKNEKWTGMAAAADGGDFYIIVGPGNQPERGELLAISSNGTPRWIAPLTFSLDQYDNTQPGLLVKDGIIYLHHYRNEIILDENGSVILNLYGVYDPATIDDAGNMYVYARDNGTIEAYGRDGARLWSHARGEYNVSILSYYFKEQPTYLNGILYVWLNNGVMALDTGGGKRWVKEYPDEITIADYYTPFDGQGNLYLVHINNRNEAEDRSNLSYISMVRPDGSEVSGARHTGPYLTLVKGLADGTYFQLVPRAPEGLDDTLNADYYKDPGTVEYVLKQSRGTWKSPRTLEQLDTFTVRAVNLSSDGELWSTTLPLFPHTVVIDKSTIGSVMPPYLDLGYAASENRVGPEEWYKDNGLPDGSGLIGSWADLELMPGKNVTYVSLWTLNYEVPTFYGKARAAYSGGIYALDKGGKLLWARPTGARVTDMKESNGTIYYGTDDGKLSAARVNIAAGAVLSAFFYLFIRFFLAGAVARARGRLDGNENRNIVMRFIAENPGSGLYDISKGLGMNMGTVRYHLLILGINHRIASFRPDDKHVRYFANQGAYRPDERSIISLMRRDAVRRTLGALLKNPGLSNRELSRELNMLDSATARYMKELVERGIVENNPSPEGRTSYVIRGEYREKIALLLERVDSAAP